MRKRETRRAELNSYYDLKPLNNTLIHFKLKCVQMPKSLYNKTQLIIKVNFSKMFRVYGHLTTNTVCYKTDIRVRPGLTVVQCS